MVNYRKLRNDSLVREYKGGGAAFFQDLFASFMEGEGGTEALNGLGESISDWGADVYNKNIDPATLAFGGNQEALNGGQKFGQFLQNTGSFISGIGKNETEGALSQAGQNSASIANKMIDMLDTAGGRLVTNLTTAKTQDENKTWKDTTKEILGGLASGGSQYTAIGTAANKVLDHVEDKLMGDKNFNQNSELIDNSVRTASKALMKAGPWGLLAAGVLESANFIDKAVGKTVQGFDVGEIGPGFNGIETSQSSTSWRGTQSKRMKRELARRAESVNMALTANEITEEEEFQMTARLNSRDNVLNANRMALAGGLNTQSLGG